MVAFWFAPWWAGGRVLAPLDILNEMMQPWRGSSESPEVKNHMVSDSVTQYLGYRLFAEDQLRNEGRIGWSDLTYGGTPAYANTMALFDDWSMQLHRWFDFWTAWHLGLVGQVMLAAGGMFLFLRGRAIPAIWAVAGAIAWAANSQFVTWVNHRWALSSFCWLPWIFLAADRWRAGRRQWGLAVPVLLALSFLGGTLQHSALIAIAVAGYWLSEQRCAAWRARFSGLPKHVLWGGAGAGLAAFMLLPQVEAFLISSRLELHTGMFKGLDDGVYPEGPLQPLLQAAAYPFQVFPWVLGGCDSVDLLKLFRSEWFYVIYFGSLPVLVGFLSLFRRDAPPLARWLVLLGLALPLTPLVRLLYQRLYLLFIFGGILAFVHFMTHASRESRQRLFRWTAGLAGIAAAVWLGGSLWVEFAGAEWVAKVGETIRMRGAGSTFGYFDEWMSRRVGRFVERQMIWSSWQLVPISLLVLSLAGLRGTASRSNLGRRVGALAVVLAVTGEVTLFAHRWVTWSDPEHHPLYAETEEVVALGERVGRDGRIRNVIDPVAHMPRTPLMQNTLVPFGIATLNGYDSIVPDGMMLPGDPDLDAARLARLGVGHLVAPAAVDVEEPGWREVWASGSTKIYENDLPADRYLGFRTKGSLDDFIGGGGGRDGSRLSEVTGKSNRRRIEVPPETAWVRIAENHVAGWEWRAADTGMGWRDVGRLPDGSMAIPLGKGGFGGNDSFEVEMRFAPPSRRMGWSISGGTLAVLALVGWFGRRTSNGAVA